MNLKEFDEVEKPKDFTLWIYITSKCNLECKHCYFKNKYNTNKEITTDDLYKILEDYLYFLRLIKVKGKLIITGGEALMRNDIFDFLKEASFLKEIFYVGLLSNGTLITKKIAKKLKKSGINGVGMSLEGMKKNNDYIRGHGTFEKTIEATKNLYEEGISSGIEFTANKLSYKELPKIVKIGKINKFSIIGTSYLVPSGKGSDLKNLVLSYKELKDYYNIADSISKNTNNPIVRLTKPLRHLIEKPNKKYVCQAHKNGAFLTVMPNGDVVPCGFLTKKIGNVKKESFIDIYTNSSFLKRLRSAKNLNEYPQCNFIKTYT